MTHGITCFFRQSDTALDEIGYNLLSTHCKAEQLWNVFAEAGKKTLVWHWPGTFTPGRQVQIAPIFMLLMAPVQAAST